MTRTPVSGRTAVITGAGSGIGRALAVRLSRLGSPVAICDWNEDAVAETASLCGDDPATVLHRALDVRDRQALFAFAADAGEWAPRPFGMIINNAGVTVSQSVAGASPEDDDWVLDVNLYGVIHGTRAFLPLLLRQGDGALVNVSSIFGIVGWPTQAAYCASKGAVRGWTESLRHELRDSSVRAVVVHPGGIATNIVRNARFHEDDRGRTDRTEMEKDFDVVARTTPEQAAKVIHEGVEAGRDRILIGADAKLLDALWRIAPSRYFNVIKAFEPLIRRQ